MLLLLLIKPPLLENIENKTTIKNAIFNILLIEFGIKNIPANEPKAINTNPRKNVFNI